MRRLRSEIVAGALAVLVAATGAGAQAARDTVVVPNPRYAASPPKTLLLGRSYRDLWTTPLRVEVLDLRAFAGGLTPMERGGGLQTRSIRFQGADGRQYSFRSVDKTPDLTQTDALRGTFAGNLIQDQTSSLHPAAALVVPMLLDAVDLAHATPRLMVMPDDPRLGEFRKEFAGMLGQIEERPEDVEDGGAGYPGFGKIISTAKLLERLEENPQEQVDAREYLTARLVDLTIGDWDRHEDQWRWGEQMRGGVHYWVPIPRDRDNAFVDFDGLVMQMMRKFVPNAVKFQDHIDNVNGLTLNARGIDRRLLVSISRPTWDSVATSVQGRLTDAVIDAAVQRLPPEYQPLNAAFLAAHLKGRRDSIDEETDKFYGMLATEVDVRATDERDLALVDRTGEGTVEVRLYEMNKQGEVKGEPYYRRAFTRGVTNEVRIYLQGGDDRAVVRGTVGKTVRVRVIGGGGDDLLADSSTVRTERAATAFYDSRGKNQIVRGRKTALESSDYSPPEPVAGLSGETYRDWGASHGTGPVLGYNGRDGLIVGVSPTYTRYGFWREPYAYKLTAQGMVSLWNGDVGVSLSGDYRNSAARGGYSFLVSASALQQLRFYGFGNETVEAESGDFYEVDQDVFLARGTRDLRLPGRGTLSVGPVAKYLMSGRSQGTPFARENVNGSRFGEVGALAEALYDTRDSPAFPLHGRLVQVGASGYPRLWDSRGFVEAHGTAAGYWTVPGRRGPTLALRAGGKKVRGDYPIQEAAFLGGSRSLRGYAFQRFAGDAALYGNAELRAPVHTLKLLVRGMLGVQGLADIGRVYLAGESSNAWHGAVGGGLWFRFNIRKAAAATSLTYAQGEDGSRVYLKFGAPF